MILSVITGLLFGSDGYYVALAWTSSALMYFIVSVGWSLPAPLLGQLWDTFILLAQPQHSSLLGAFFADCSLGP